MSGDARLEIAAFGTLGLVRGGRPVHVGPPKQQLVLAILVVKVDTEVSAAELVDVVWGEYAPPSAGDTLRLYISQLRRVLGPDVIVGHGQPGYRLCGDRVGIDLRRFRALHAAATALLATGDLAAARSVLVGAVGGRSSGGPARDAYPEPRSRTLEELWRLASEQRFQPDAGRRPYREQHVYLAMLALSRSGRHREAVAMYRRTAEQLVERHGVEPSAELSELHRAIVLHQAALSPQAVGPHR